MHFKEGEEPVKTRNDKTMRVTLETNGKVRSKGDALFETGAREEKALCGVDAAADDRIGVDYLL